VKALVGSRLVKRRTGPAGDMKKVLRLRLSGIVRIMQYWQIGSATQKGTSDEQYSRVGLH